VTRKVRNRDFAKVLGFERDRISILP